MAICVGRTIIVTGAGRGLGREYALLLCREGANVVVNDIRLEAAANTVQEIHALGGQALADCGDITRIDGATSILRAAIERFGEVHGVINNAGIVRDRMFVSLTEEDWDEVIRVHLKGHFCLSSQLVRHWREQVKDGLTVNARIINTSSGAGLQGSVGQSNYAAAKAGIAALTLVQAVELRRYGITANALAPAARTGMTEQVFAEVMKKPADGSFDHYDPANVAPLVVWLCSAAAAHVSGQVFEVEGGKISIASGWKRGPVCDKGARWLPAEVGAAVDQLLVQAPQPQKVYGT